MTIWFNKKKGINKVYDSKSITIAFYPQHWNRVYYSTNEPEDYWYGRKWSVYEFDIMFFGFALGYINWDFNKQTDNKK